MKAIGISNKKTPWFIIALFTGALIALNACSPSVAEAQPIIPTTCPECNVVSCPEPVRYEELWAASGHANSETEAFTHWDEADPQEIPTDCAKCHSRPGFIDFLGVDGTKAGQVDNPASIGTTVTCFVCHNEATDELNSVIFPSGVKVRMLGPEALCIQCHQGRASTSSVDTAITELGLVDPDVPSTELRFINSHSTAGATPFGAEVQGAYQYAGKNYHGQYKRGEDFFACTNCHEQHSLELKFDTCLACHTLAGTEARDIRVDTTDFDGDGNITEGIAFEIGSLHDSLYAAIQAYAVKVVGTPIAYDADTHPYFFIDTNGNGEIDLEENLANNRYNAWTPRLLRAAYNYNYVTHDPGAYAHNSEYILQVLYDSLEDLGGDTSKMTRP